jgi:hypothetical protein
MGRAAAWGAITGISSRSVAMGRFDSREKIQNTRSEKRRSFHGISGIKAEGVTLL